jgi:hypothetical protein
MHIDKFKTVEFALGAKVLVPKNIDVDINVMNGTRGDIIDRPADILSFTV